MKLSVIIPVYNEHLYIEEVLRRVCKAKLPDPVDSDYIDRQSEQASRITHIEIVCVDDCSKDGSRELLRDIQKNFSERFGKHAVVPASFVYFEQEKNSGKGAAVRRGLEASTGDFVIVQDADLEYNPRDYARLIQPLLEGKADAVFGSRFIGESRRVLLYWHSVINKFLTALSNMLTDLCLTDMETGYKVIRGDLARALNLVSDRFGFEPEIVAKLAKANARIFEVPVSYQGRSYDEGKKIGVKDGIAALWHILRFNLFAGTPLKPGSFQTLIALQKFSRNFYERHVLSTLREKGYLQKGPFEILEIGAGVGTITQTLIKLGRVTAVDQDPTSIDHLKRRFHFLTNFDAVVGSESNLPEQVKSKKYDLVVAFNVLEHHQNDKSVLAQWGSLLQPGGRILILVPNNPSWFTPIDHVFGHIKRYSKKELQSTIRDGGLECETMRFVNFFGIFGWILNGKILRRNFLPEGQLKIYNKLMPLLLPFERIFCNFSGLSIMVVARRSR